MQWNVLQKCCLVYIPDIQGRFQNLGQFCVGMGLKLWSSSFSRSRKLNHVHLFIVCQCQCQLSCINCVLIVKINTHKMPQGLTCEDTCSCHICFVFGFTLVVSKNPEHPEFEPIIRGVVQVLDLPCICDMSITLFNASQRQRNITLFSQYITLV